MTAEKGPSPENVDAGEELHVAGGVAEHDEDDLALVPGGDNTAGERDDVLGVGAGLEVGVALDELCRVRGDVEAVAIRLDAGRAKGVELRAPDGEGVVLEGGLRSGGRVVSHHDQRLIARILYSTTFPEGVVTLTVSPFLRPMIA